MSETLTALKCELRDSLSELLHNMAPPDRSELEPEQLGTLARGVVRHLFGQLVSPDLAETRHRGRQIARRGLSQRNLLTMCSHVRGLASERLGPHDSSILKALEGHLAALTEGFMEALLDEIVEDQEQIRLNLSTTLSQQSRELLIKNHAIETSRNAIMLTDMDGLITYANPACLQMWGHQTEEELIGRSCGAVVSFFQDRDIDQILAESLGPGGDTTASRGDGSMFDVEVTTSLISDESERPVGMMASFRDITESKRLEAQIRQSQKMDALGQLAGGIVHDFNNLLTAISGYSQLLLMDIPKESQQYEDFAQIKIATDKAKDLTNQLRFFTRQASGQKERLDFNKTLAETYSILVRTFPREVILRSDPADNLWSIDADESQMTQLVMNLCVNARDAILQDNTEGGVLTLSTRNRNLSTGEAGRHIDAKPGRYICFRARDTGIGMTADVTDRLFEPFFTTKGEAGGTGLGLAIAYGIVQNHGGFIEVTSTPGAGSLFDFYLPALDTDQETADEAREEESLVAGSGLILVVDDEPQVRAIATRTLELCGYSTLEASDGLEAIETYREHSGDVDLVILDMVMPKMGGRRCLERLRSIDPDIRVVGITGFTTDRTYQDFMESDCHAVLEKPLDLHKFSRVVHEALGEER